MSRKRATADSLDLLLDTICNTFGGVLFIAMLVIILLNMTGKQASRVAPDAKVQETLSEERRQLAESKAELDRLRKASEQQTKIAQLLSKGDLRTLAEQATAAQVLLTARTALRADNLEESAADQSKATQVAEALAALDKALAEARQRLAAVDQELTVQRQLRSRTVNLPRKQKTDKTQVSFLLRDGGRLYAYQKPSAGGAMQRETPDTQVVSKGSKKVIVPVAGGGAVVDPRCDTAGGVARKFAAWDPKRHYISIFIWPDSFEHYFVVRQRLLERGFEYQLVPLTADSAGPVTGTARTDVQGTQ